MDYVRVLRALPYEARAILLETAWLSAFMTSQLCGLGDDFARSTADDATEAIADHLDEVIAA